MQLWNKLCK